MKRVRIAPRTDWEHKVEQLGFGFHSIDTPYWDESAYYHFSYEQVEQLEKATRELWTMCLHAVQHVIDNRLYNRFLIPEWFVSQIERSWNEDHPSVYGRFDLAYKNGQIKMLEFNADTPTSLYEAGIIQWYWLQDFNPGKDQFNSIHEKLINCWQYLKPYLHRGILHFSCVKDSLEDLTTTEYLRDCAIQAGIKTHLVFIEDIGWDAESKVFVDMEDRPLRNLFKLYPYEWLTAEEFGKNIIADTNNTLWIEPAWKMILSNKALLPVLWQLYPGHPYLLSSGFDANQLDNYVKKPILSREGANIELFRQGRLLAKTEGTYGAEGFIYQELCTLPEYEGQYALIGSWVIGQEPAGIGIREHDQLITTNSSRFIPHLID